MGYEQQGSRVAGGSRRGNTHLHGMQDGYKVQLNVACVIIVKQAQI